MNILFLYPSHSFPAKDGWQRQRELLIKELVLSGHNCTVISFTRSADLFDLRAFQEATGASVDSISYVLDKNYGRVLVDTIFGMGATRIVKRKIAELRATKALDVLVFDSVCFIPLLSEFDSIPVVVSCIDDWASRQRRMMLYEKSYVKKVALFGYWLLCDFVQRRWLPMASGVQLVSSAEADALQRLIPDAHVTCVPVMLEEDDVVACPTLALPGRIVFWGNLNVPYLRDGFEWFLSHVWPLLHARCATRSLELVVIGRSPNNILVESGGGVRFLNWVDDIDAELRTAQVVVSPDPTGSGVKNRVIQCMALGVPVVGTTYAYEGIDITSGVQGVIADVPEAFASAIASLVNDNEKRNQMGAAGARFAKDNYSKSKVAQQWTTLLEKTLGNKSAF